MSDPHDWTADPRPFPAKLHEFLVRHNGGSTRGARQNGEALLGLSKRQIASILDDRKRCTYETTVCRLMTMVERDASSGNESGDQ